MKTWTKRQYLTYILLFVLLLVDFSQSLFSLIINDLIDPSVLQIYINQLRILANLLFAFQWLGSFPVIIFILSLNRERLQEMNIDRFYACMLVTAGLIPLYKSPIISPYNFPYNVFGVIALIYAVYILFSNKVKFGVIDSNALRMLLLIAGVFAGITVCIAGSKLSFPSSGQSLDRFLFAIIPGSIYEEAMYRGVLYMFLMDVGVSKSKAFFIQAFWFSGKHVHFLLASPFVYWIILPILGLTFGYIVMRSKSLTPSTVAHLLYSTLVLFVYS